MELYIEISNPKILFLPITLSSSQILDGQYIWEKRKNLNNLVKGQLSVELWITFALKL